jgi:uncharacterized protein (DUF1800 family)
MLADTQQGSPGTVAVRVSPDPDWSWARYEPDARRPWDARGAGHLFRRAGFGARSDELRQAVTDGPHRTIDRLLAPADDVKAFNAPYDAQEAASTDSDSAESLRAWWLHRMIGTPHPLLEKMMLFWHGYFATSNSRVKSALLMQRQAAALRRCALGRFDELVKAMAHDTALLTSLDAAANRKALPAANFARELLETFTLGAGNYAERDVKETARAFTGCFVERREFRYLPREHDEGVKTILGHEGNWDGDDAIRIILGRPEAPRFAVRKLYRWLISETDEPSDALIAPLADSFGRDWDIARLTERILRSNLFFSPFAYRRRVKSPVEFAVGIVRGLEGLVPTAPLGADLAGLGQDLYDPPTVKGWAGGQRWITRATVIGRSNLALALLGGPGPYGAKLDPEAVARKHGRTDVDGFLVDLFMQGDVDRAMLVEKPAAGGGESLSPGRRFAHALMALPEFQLA